MRNILEKIANTDDRAEAIKLLTDALGAITPSLIEIHISDAYRWRKVSNFTRLTELGRLLTAETFELMDCTKGRDPNDSVGTRD